jgi:hypothetical protein
VRAAWAVLPTSDAAGTPDATCEHACVTANEWEVAKAIPCHLLGEAKFIVSDADVARALDVSTNVPVDERALEAIVGLEFPNEARLRRRLIDLGVDFDPLAPPWYRELLRQAVTPDSGKPHLYDDSIKVTYAAENRDPGRRGHGREPRVPRDPPDPVRRWGAPAHRPGSRPFRAAANHEGR